MVTLKGRLNLSQVVGSESFWRKCISCLFLG